jgi:hypothetical protein
MASEVWQRALGITGVLINGEAVDPWLIATTDSATAPAPNSIELRIATLIALHELHECDVDVSEETLAEFVSSDFANSRHKAKAMRAYLDFARGSLPRKKVFGLFVKEAREPVPLWFWNQVTNVSLERECLVIKGRCYGNV